MKAKPDLVSYHVPDEEIDLLILLAAIDVNTY